VEAPVREREGLLGGIPRGVNFPGPPQPRGHGEVLEATHEPGPGVRAARPRRLDELCYRHSISVTFHDSQGAGHWVNGYRRHAMMASRTVPALIVAAFALVLLLLVAWWFLLSPITTGALVRASAEHDGWQVRRTDSVLVSAEPVHGIPVSAGFLRASRLHPLIESEARPQFLINKPDQGVFAWMKAVEIRVRRLAGLGDELIGADLMS
jgi:hypothetical protein